MQERELAKKKSRKTKRRYVSRNDRIGPTRETLAKLPVDPFPGWVKLGAADGGLEPQQVTALIELADAFASVTAKLGYKPMVFQWQAPGAIRDMSNGEARAWTVWFAWAIAFERRAMTEPGEGRLINGFRVAQWVIGRDRKVNAGPTADPRLAMAADLWARVSADYDRGLTVSAADYHPAIDRPAAPERARIRTWVEQPA